MNARTRPVGNAVGLHVVTGEMVGVQLHAGRWNRVCKALQRIRLLMAAPVASLRWGWAKRRIVSKKRKAQQRLGRRNGLADCARDGIVMGF